MFGKASSSQPSIGLSGSGALSHVYIQYPPLRCSTPETRSLHYDDGNKLLISSTSDQVMYSFFNLMYIWSASSVLDFFN